MTGTLKDIQKDIFKGEFVITLSVGRTLPSSLKELIGQEVDVDVKKHRRDRSLYANRYAWALIGKLAEVLATTKEEVYREFVQRIGTYEVVPIKAECVDEWIRKWNKKGLGWHAEVFQDSKIDGYKNVINYFGSSVYNSKEMARLIDEIVGECKEQGIETMSPDELVKLCERWK